ncbi:hypothetical protein PTKIN_Ptkin03bG0028400 [Pterospermum kingtungense]
MFKLLQIKGTLQLLLLAITMKYVHGARVATADDTTIAANPIPTPVSNVASMAGPTVVASNPISPLAATTGPSDQPTLSFFMHDIFGGSAPSVRVVAGIMANTQPQVNENGIPFSKPNGAIFPKSHGVPLINNGNKNLMVTNGKSLPFVTAGQLPQGAMLQKLLFGTITVIDDELTKGHELGSSIIGKAQGFYLASSMDGSSHTMAFTAMFHDDDEDAISFFGVHRTVAVESPIAVVGGTGRYENAQGYAIIETLHHTNEYTTDGIDTLIQFSVYLTH